MDEKIEAFTNQINSYKKETIDKINHIGERNKQRFDTSKKVLGENSNDVNPKNIIIEEVRKKPILKSPTKSSELGKSDSNKKSPSSKIKLIKNPHFKKEIDVSEYYTSNVNLEK